MTPTSERQRDGVRAAADERSLGELVRELPDQSARLGRLEVELAKAEVTRKGRQLGLGAGAIGAAGMVALYAFGALTAAAILGLAQAVDAWLAALIVATVYGAVGAILALTGKGRVDAATPPAPERAIESSRADIEAARQSVKEARS